MTRDLLERVVRGRHDVAEPRHTHAWMRLGGLLLVLSVIIAAAWFGLHPQSVLTSPEPSDEYQALELRRGGYLRTGSFDAGAGAEGSRELAGAPVDPDLDDAVPESWLTAWASRDQATIDAWFEEHTGPRTEELEDVGSSDDDAVTLETQHDGQVIEGKRVYGRIQVLHDDVTIRDVEIINPHHLYSIMRPSDGPSAMNTRVEHVRVLAAENFEGRAFQLSPGATVYRTHTVGHSSAMQLKSGDRFIESYVFRADDFPDDIPHGGGGVAVHGGSDIEVLRSNFKIGSRGSGPFLLYANAGPVQNVLVQDNVFNGGGYCIYGGETHSEYEENKGIRFIGNRFGTEIWPECGRHGPRASWNPDRPGNEWTNNIWLATGEPIG